MHAREAREVGHVDVHAAPSVRSRDASRRSKSQEEGEGAEGGEAHSRVGGRAAADEAGTPGALMLRLDPVRTPNLAERVPAAVRGRGPG